MALLTAARLRGGGALRWLTGWSCAWCSLLTAAPAPPAGPTEYQIKAVFIFNFARFVEWPATAFADPRAPFVIGVLGEDPFGGALDEAAGGEKINGRDLVLRRFRRVEEIADCHILFISRSESKRFGEILAALGDRSVLTVSDADEFATRGGMIRFVTERKRVRLRINPAAARAAHLELSSKLLRPAELVNPGKDPP
jgi:hypothetical protein